MPGAKEVKTDNDYLISSGENLPNHSASMMGRGKFIRQSRMDIPTFRDRQSAFRYAAYVVEMADALLPDDDGQEGVTFNDVRSAIRNA
ncbi:MAG TPA: hypothetical protein VMP68_31345 [Candidatus Eisenbacteria bacterium]|nr:hypothetical protein [Candidatus Eisenbacteria bacterium]